MRSNLKLLSVVFGLVPRLIGAGVWYFGLFRYRALYYAENPKRVEQYLETDPRAIFIYGRADRIGLPQQMACRGRSVRQLVPQGTTEADPTVLDALAPRRRGGLAGRHVAGGGLMQRIYAWTLMMQFWYTRLRSGQEKRLCRPPMKWIAQFFDSSAVPRHVRVTGVSVRTLKRDLAELLHPRPGSVAELLSAEFFYLWSSCENERFVLRESETRLRTLVERMQKSLATHTAVAMAETVGGKPVYQPL